MHFVLKHTGATYQRMVNKVFKHQIGKNMKAYIDDMVVKSITFEQHLKDLEEVFSILSSCQMKLNPAKCVFTIKVGRFMGFLVSNKGIKSNPKKIQAILDIIPP